jgi:hypothetical protein
MTGCVERGFFLRGSGSIPSSGQWAGGGDRGRGACSGFDRRLPRAYSRSGRGRLGRHRIGSRGSAGLGLSHEHQVPFLNGTGRRWLASCWVSDCGSAELPALERNDEPNVPAGNVARDGCPPWPARLRSRRSSRFPGATRAGATGLEPATSGVTGRRSNQLSYAPEGAPSIAGATGFGRTGGMGRSPQLSGRQ